MQRLRAVLQAARGEPAARHEEGRHPDEEAQAQEPGGSGGAEGDGGTPDAVRMPSASHDPALMFTSGGTAEGGRQPLSSAERANLGKKRLFDDAM